MLKTIGLEPSAAIGGRHVEKVIGELPLVVHRGGARSLSAVHLLPECRNPNLSSSLARIGAPNGSFNRISKHSLLSLSFFFFFSPSPSRYLSKPFSLSPQVQIKAQSIERVLVAASFSLFSHAPLNSNSECRFNLLNEICGPIKMVT